MLLIGLLALSVTACATDSNTTSQSSASAAPATTSVNLDNDEIRQVTELAISYYNNGDLGDLERISCGQLASDLDATDQREFTTEAADYLESRGAGTVAEVSHIKTLKSFATADVLLSYAKLPTEQLLAVQGVYEKTDGAWKICGLGQ
jgi:hypothetical protein